MATYHYLDGYRAGLGDAEPGKERCEHCPHPPLSEEWDDWMQGHAAGILTILGMIERGRQTIEDEARGE